MSEKIIVELSEEENDELLSEYVTSKYDGSYEEFLAMLAKLGLKLEKAKRFNSK